jgi:para-aminobenzoate synthetase component 1
MRTFDPYGWPLDGPPLPTVIGRAALREPTKGPRPAGLVECGRLEWRVSEGGDPAGVLVAFLDRYGLRLPGGHAAVTECGRFRTGVDGVAGVVGAVVFLSAAACALMSGGKPGAPSPAPAIPDLAAVVYAPTERCPPTARAAQESWWLGGWRPSWSPDQHMDAVRAVREAIAQGQVYQVNLVGHASAPYRGDPLPALRRVTQLAGARYPWLLGGQDWAIACASPETLVRVHAGRIETLPIKGTRPATAAGAAQLLSSAKERAEHVMIVDLARNDLARIARTGSVAVPSLFAVQRWCDLWQAESRVCAELAEGVDLGAVLRALCPGGSVTGAPKLAALEVIAALEPVGRGPSMGALGWLTEGTLDLGLTIRTVAVDEQRVHVWAGGGITWDSDPASEVAEAAAKAAPLRAAFSP